MITRKRTLNLPDTYPLERIGSLHDMIFFDIETTGFSGEYSNLYLIGCTYFRNGSWNLIQWFADTADSEAMLLTAFFDFLSGFTILLHFNGDGFDIPYLLKRCRFHNLSYDFSGITSIDIYKRIKSYRRLLQLDSLKQKSIEHFLSVSRDDLYSGGQLIEVYKDYLVTHDDFLYDLLILHNEDDLKGMPSILPILSYPDFLEHNFILKSLHDFITPDNEHILTLELESPFSIPVPLNKSNGQFSINAKDSDLLISVRLFDGELRYFYPDYKNYYYLIYEDTAVHKSIGEYVDREARTKASAKNCYTRKSSTFIPQLKTLWEPEFRAELKDSVTYAEYSQNLFSDTEKLSIYIHDILNSLTMR